MARLNLLSLFDDFALLANDIAIVHQRGYRREAWTYGKLTQAAAFFARLLKERGIRAGDRILLWGPNSAEWVAAFWGCLLRGAVVVALDDSSTPEFAARIAADASTKLAFTARSGNPGGVPSLVFADFPDAGEELPEIALNRHSGKPSEAYWQSFADEPITRDHIAQILFTSGTTSEPRGVVLTHGNFLANLEPLEQGIDEYRKYERWAHPLRFVSLVPLSHVFGQFMTLFIPPLLGAAVVFEPSPHSREILRTIKRERATALVAVPRMLDGLRAGMLRDVEKRGELGEFQKSYAAAEGRKFLRRAWTFRRIHARLGWKFWAFISGGAALSQETEEFFKRIGYAVVQGYGMTETASLISLNHPFRATEGSVGKVLPGREFRLAEDGEILVRGENVSSSYWEEGALREASHENGGWLRTGDLGELDAGNNLRFRGRKKNVIVTPAGLNIYPEDLEAALRKQRAIRDAVVIPLQIGANAEPCAILLPDGESEAVGRPGGASSAPTKETGEPTSRARAAIDAANASLAEYQRIRRWLLWPEPDFPRTPTGKPRLGLIASRAAELLRAKVAAAEDVGLKPGATFAGADFSDLSSISLKDLSSLDRVELLSTLEHRYQVELNETQFANAQTTEELKQLLAEPAARSTDYVYPRWTQSTPVQFFRLLVYYALTWPATAILAHPRILGREHLAKLHGPALFVTNHTTRRADIGLILISLPTRFRHRLAPAMGGEILREFRNPPREWMFAKRWLWRFKYFCVVSLFNVFPLPQLSGFRESFRFAGETVDRGYSLLVFPEGIINDRDSPEMIAFRPGIGLLAENLRLPIVPMRLDGVWQMKQERRRLAHPGEITVHIGAPVTFPPETSPAEIASRLQDLVRSL